YFNYGINRQKHDRQVAVSTMSRLFLVYLAANIALLAAGLALLPVNQHLIFAIIILATLPSVVLFSFCARLLQAMNEIDWLNRVNMVQVSLFFLFALALYILFRSDHEPSTQLLTATFGAWFISNWVAAGVALALARRLAHVSVRPRRDKDTMRGTLHYGNRMGAQMVITQANKRGDFYMVLLLAGVGSASIYGIAVSASEILWHMSSSIALIVYTRVAAHDRSESIALTERTFRITLWFMIIGAVAMGAIFSPLIHIIYTDKYAGSAAPFVALLVGTAAFGAVGVLTQFFTDQLGRVHFTVYMQAISAIANIALCLLLIPHYGIVGAACASSAAYVIALAIAVWYYKKHTGRPVRLLFIPTKGDVSYVRNLVKSRRAVHESGE
ncbi:MAG: polysaccharide biosynthesis C-terminal domain-containing protein, partial [Firmicutes bacterium]|nr:polysaccharide biosynthesis C-terminal domain-containing protein [Bacillota bacterium]